MFQIGVGLFDVTAGAVQHSDVLLKHPQRLVTGRNVAVEAAVRRFIGRCTKLRRVAKHILPGQRQFCDFQQAQQGVPRRRTWPFSMFLMVRSESPERLASSLRDRCADSLRCRSSAENR
jgi:hypothetical protein